MILRRSALALLPAMLLAQPLTAFAQSPGVTVEKTWARATPPGAPTGALYMTFTSPTGDKLTGAESPRAATTSLHEMHMAGNVMQMRAVPGGLDLPAGTPVTLKPGGLHLMMEGLKGPLKPGETVPVHLTFAKAPPVDVTVAVGAMGASGPVGGGGGMGAMPGMTMSK